MGRQAGPAQISATDARRSLSARAWSRAPRMLLGRYGDSHLIHCRRLTQSRPRSNNMMAHLGTE